MPSIKQLNDFVLRNPEVSVTQRVVTCVTLHTILGPVTGVAVLSPADTFSPEQGERLARKRAYQRLAQRLLRSGLSYLVTCQKQGDKDAS